MEPIQTLVVCTDYHRTQLILSSPVVFLLIPFSTGSIDQDRRGHESLALSQLKEVCYYSQNIVMNSPDPFGR